MRWRRSSSPKTKPMWSSACRALGEHARRGGLVWLGGVARARPVAAASLVPMIAQVAARFLATGRRPCVARQVQREHAPLRRHGARWADASAAD
uniref:Uncharacterized protein n=1 Tax=Arundo donax TaxID=35708 RepID=A0A0A9BBQ4_ARUDO